MSPQQKVPKTTTSTAARTPTTGGGSRRTLWIALGGAAVVAIALIGGSLLLRGRDHEGSSTTPATGSTAVVDGIPQEDNVPGDEEALWMHLGSQALCDPEDDAAHQRSPQ